MGQATGFIGILAGTFQHNIHAQFGPGQAGDFGLMTQANNVTGHGELFALTFHMTGKPAMGRIVFEQMCHAVGISDFVDSDDLNKLIAATLVECPQYISANAAKAINGESYHIFMQPKGRGRLKPQRSFYYGVNSDVEVLEQLAGRGRFTKGVHAHNCAIKANVLVPAFFRQRFNGNAFHYGRWQY